MNKEQAQDTKIAPEEIISAQVIKVSLAERSYDIVISEGLRHKIGAELRTRLNPRWRKIAIISNAKVFGYYGADVAASLMEVGFKVSHLLIGDGERFKNLRTLDKIYAFLLAQGLDRNDLVLALGGGVVGDIAGYAAATYLRGIDVVQVPTTLLAQIDSAIGGKTGVNFQGKNLVGAFHQPKMVLIDAQTLNTLPKRELRAALQEAIKYGVIADKELFDLIEQHKEAILRCDTTLLKEIIIRSCRIKAGVVSRDEHESGERKILNFGHTIGHALEAVTNYRRFKHGEAVGYGIIGASKIAVEMKFLTLVEAQRIEQLVLTTGHLPEPGQLDLNDIMAKMSKDKKALQGELTFILPKSIGHVIIQESVPVEAVHQAVSATLKGEASL